MTSRVRVLPLMIIVMFLMFSEKALNIWQSASGVDFGSGIEFKPVLAQQSGSGDAPQSAPRPVDGSADSEGLPPGSRPLEETNEETPIVGDPNRFSEREIQLLQELAERRNVLDAREQQLEEREALLKAAEQRLLEKQTELNIKHDETFNKQHDNAQSSTAPPAGRAQQLAPHVRAFGMYLMLMACRPGWSVRHALTFDAVNGAPLKS